MRRLGKDRQRAIDRKREKKREKLKLAEEAVGGIDGKTKERREGLCV